MASQTGFAVRRVAVAPGRERPYVEAEWRGALVVLARGRIELEGLSGARRSFAPGAALWLDGLPLRALRNHGREPAVMIAFTRLR